MAETASLSQKRRLPESNRCKIPEGDVSASALLPELDICGHSSCPGSELDPEFPALVCTLPIGHGGMHHQEGVNCAQSLEFQPLIADPDFTLYVGDVRHVLRSLPEASVHCCVTSPPYWGLRDYGAEGQIGLETTPEEYVEELVQVFAEVARVLRPDGTLWMNLGDSYAGGQGGDPRSGFNSRYFGKEFAGQKQAAAAGQFPLMSRITAGLKPKDLVGIPWRVAFALQADGWYLRSDIIWSKPNPMPESVTDRPTKAHEYVFLLSRSPRYFYDADAIRETYERGQNTYGYRGGGPNSKNAAAYLNQSGPQHNSVARGPDGRRKTTVQGGENSQQHRNGERWPHPTGRNKRSVWEISALPYPEAHFATFPTALVEPCIKAGCPTGGLVLDPFMGSGTTALVARRLGRQSIGIELNPEYANLAAKRLQQLSLLADAQGVS